MAAKRFSLLTLSLSSFHPQSASPLFRPFTYSPLSSFFSLATFSPLFSISTHSCSNQMNYQFHNQLSRTLRHLHVHKSQYNVARVNPRAVSLEPPLSNSNEKVQVLKILILELEASFRRTLCPDPGSTTSSSSSAHSVLKNIRALRSTVASLSLVSDQSDAQISRQVFQNIQQSFGSLLDKLLLLGDVSGCLWLTRSFIRVDDRLVPFSAFYRLISRLFLAKNFDAAREIYSHCLASLDLRNAVVHCAMLNGYMSHDMFEEYDEVARDVAARGLPLSEFFFVCQMKRFGKERRTDDVIRVWKEYKEWDRSGEKEEREESQPLAMYDVFTKALLGHADAVDEAAFDFAMDVFAEFQRTLTASPLPSPPPPSSSIDLPEYEPHRHVYNTYHSAMVGAGKTSKYVTLSRLFTDLESRGFPLRLDTYNAYFSAVRRLYANYAPSLGIVPVSHPSRDLHTDLAAVLTRMRDSGVGMNHKTAYTIRHLLWTLPHLQPAMEWVLEWERKWKDRGRERRRGGEEEEEGDDRGRRGHFQPKDDTVATMAAVQARLQSTLQQKGGRTKRRACDAMLKLYQSYVDQSEFMPNMWVAKVLFYGASTTVTHYDYVTHQIEMSKVRGGVYLEREKKEE